MNTLYMYVNVHTHTPGGSVMMSDPASTRHTYDTTSNRNTAATNRDLLSLEENHLEGPYSADWNSFERKIPSHNPDSLQAESDLHHHQVSSSAGIFQHIIGAF